MSHITEKLAHIQSATQSHWALYISPDVEKLPFEIARFDDPYLPYMRSIYKATQELVCAYVLDFGAYLKLGAAGAVALERSIDLISGAHLVILDAAIASTRYVGLWDETAYGCDALTIADSRVLESYQNREDRAGFLMTDERLDERETASYWLKERIFGIGTARIHLLPDDVLFSARSLDFEGKLHDIVSAVVRG